MEKWFIINIKIKKRYYEIIFLIIMKRFIWNKITKNKKENYITIHIFSLEIRPPWESLDSMNWFMLDSHSLF